ncbi:hypothetical protein EAW52_10800 [Pseudomonas sp. LTJR-52]|uniref:hypothetical protein n=1 Tax=Pseudomonas sp. LTJR-52 TaxID=2479392 RepID=UPI000EFC53E2|nr:hypothetical protein [Pseudomonas sp. LTJR-52]AYN94412.1 hypothetical protein EAW52_10800 [Pseudomonas sp. LTJR-52]
MPTNLPPPPGPNAGLSEWIAWGIVAVMFAGGFIFKGWWEKSGKGKESEKILDALAQEREAHKETKAHRDEVQRLLEESRQQNNALIREFADIKAANAKMELNITYLTEEIAELKAELLKRNP